jgi:hypothetical protein
MMMAACSALRAIHCSDGMVSRLRAWLDCHRTLVDFQQLMLVFVAKVFKWKNLQNLFVNGLCTGSYGLTVNRGAMA